MSRFVAVCAFGLLAVAAGRAATVGFTQDFNAGLGGFGGGSGSYTRVPSGGVGGVGDGYLEVANPTFARQLGARTLANKFTGNLIADGVTGFSFWLSDVGGNDNIEIHVGVGSALTNFWLSLDGFVPPDGGWGNFSVDITNASGWVQIIGAGTFSAALASSNRLLFRHDLSPFGQSPDVTLGDFGLDRITVLPEPASLVLMPVGALLVLRRRSS